MSVAAGAQQRICDGNLLLAMPVAAAAGFVWFAWPCVLPLVPGYLSYVSGVAGQEVHQRGGRRPGRVLLGLAWSWWATGWCLSPWARPLAR
jgi:cytochrome c-type biogenesis protein